MELLERYLKAVRRHLPWSRQDDIIAEMRANLEAQLEDKQAELGRPLTAEETEAWVKQLGSPLQVAARYQRQQYLIGPALYPTYSYVLRLVLTWLTVIYVVANAVTIAVSNQGGEKVLDAALRLPSIWLINAGIVTLIFALIELASVRSPEKFRGLEAMAEPMTAPWSPMDLPTLGESDGDWSKPRSFMRALLEVFAGSVFLGWLLLVPHYPFLLFGPGAWYLQSLPYQLAPVWWTFYWLVVPINIFELAWKVADLARGAWQRQPSRARHLAMHALSLVPLCVLLAAPNHMLFLLKNPAMDAAEYGATVASANNGVFKGVAVVIAIIVLQLLWGIGRASLDAYRKREAAK
jgi:hypothetical protein